MLSCMIRGTGGRRTALGRQVKLLREGQRLSLEAAARKAQLSAVTWRRVEHGQGVQGRTYRAVEETLSLPRGVIDDYLAKKVPVEALEAPPQPAPEEQVSLQGLPEETKQAIRNMIRAMRDNPRQNAS